MLRMLYCATVGLLRAMGELGSAVRQGQDTAHYESEAMKRGCRGIEPMTSYPLFRLQYFTSVLIYLRITCLQYITLHG